MVAGPFCWPGRANRVVCLTVFSVALELTFFKPDRETQKEEGVSRHWEGAAGAITTPSSLWIEAEVLVLELFSLFSRYILMGLARPFYFCFRMGFVN